MYLQTMQKIITEEIFSAPQWLKIMYYFSSLILLIMGIGLLINLDVIQGVVLLIPLIFLLAISMLIYTRLKLVVSNVGIRFSGGLKPHSFSWANITKVDMDRTGKYRTPKATIFYSNRTLVLDRSFYHKNNFKRILLLLEMKIEPGLFTEKYQDIRRQINQE